MVGKLSTILCRDFPPKVTHKHDSVSVFTKPKSLQLIETLLQKRARIWLRGIFHILTLIPMLILEHFVRKVKIFPTFAIFSIKFSFYSSFRKSLYFASSNFQACFLNQYTGSEGKNFDQTWNGCMQLFLS